MPKRILTWVCAAVLWSPVARPACDLPDLSPSTLSYYQEAIEPDESEMSFLQIDWQSQLGPAVQLAHRSHKPLLIYVMNGHPLGCT